MKKWLKLPLCAGIGHKCAQRYDYIEEGGGKGFVSISAKINDSKTTIFISCNFATVKKNLPTIN
jgi:hypothetical protein